MTHRKSKKSWGMVVTSDSIITEQQSATKNTDNRKLYLFEGFAWSPALPHTSVCGIKYNIFHLFSGSTCSSFYRMMLLP